MYIILIVLLIMLIVCISYTAYLCKKDKKDKRAFISLIKEIVMEFDSKDPYFNGHTRRVLEFALEIADRIGLDKKERFFLELSIYVGQISKIRISEKILYKREKLTEEEFNIIKKTPIIAYKMVDGIPEIDIIKDVVKAQHEKYNGAGYPNGLKGDQIPLLARIINIADSYDAMISERPYKEPLKKREALQELEKEKNRQFDPKLVDVAMEILQEEELKLI